MTVAEVQLGARSESSRFEQLAHVTEVAMDLGARALRGAFRIVTMQDFMPQSTLASHGDSSGSHTRRTELPYDARG